MNQSFDVFWAAYPRKTAKRAALKAWIAIRPDAALLAQIVASLAWQRQQESWLRESGRFIPYPSTWLTQARWEDEQTKTPRLNANTVAAIQSAKEFLES